MSLASFVPFLSARTPIGIDVGDDAVRAIQLDARSNAIRAMARMPLPENEQRSGSDFSQKLRRTLRKQGFHGTRCCLSAPRELIYLHPIRVPQMPASELKECLSWEAAERFSLSRERIEVDGISSGARSSSPGDERSEFILFAFDHVTAAPWLESIVRAGYAPLSLEPGFCAVARTHSQLVRREKDRGQVQVVLDISAGGSSLVYLRGDQIGFCRSFKIGGDDLDQVVASHLSLDCSSASALRRDRRLAARGGRQIDQTADQGATEASMPLLHDLVEQVALCLRHCAVAFSGSRPQHIVISGRDACEPGLAQLIENRTGISTNIDDAQSNVLEIGKAMSVAGIRGDDPSAWTAAMGLALRPIQGRSARQRMRRAA
ncbi:MAG: hypothetical protein CBC35_06490 [Planctomycetes bacterium TMED75]|nr:hypothetical protein [Planctomycetaceae bacterium]OUU92950.1 MAG: hypothetical protein CBC35_06490 [Planctomycetes bacterium TMED75]